MFLKIYETEETMCTLAGGVDDDTFRKWAWLFIEAIASLKPFVVSTEALDAGLMVTHHLQSF